MESSSSSSSNKRELINVSLLVLISFFFLNLPVFIKVQHGKPVTLETLPSEIICDIFSRLDDMGSRMSMMMTSKSIMSAIQDGSSACWSSSRQLIVDELTKPQWPHGNKTCISLLDDIQFSMVYPKIDPLMIRPFSFSLARLLLMPENPQALASDHDPVLDHKGNCRKLFLALALAGDVALFDALMTRPNVQTVLFPSIVSEAAFQKGLVQRAVLSGNVAFIEIIFDVLVRHCERKPSDWTTCTSKHMYYARHAHVFQMAVASGNVDVLVYLKGHKDIRVLLDTSMLEACITIACFHNHVSMLEILTSESMLVSDFMSIDAVHDAIALHDPDAWCYNMALAARQGNADVLKWFRVSFHDQFLDIVVSKQDDFLTVDDLCLFTNDPMKKFNRVLYELLVNRWFGDALGRVLCAENCLFLNASIVSGNLKIVQLLHVLGMTKADIHPASVPATLEMFVELRDNWDVSKADIDISSTSIYCILGLETRVICELREHWGASESYRTVKNTIKDIGLHSEHRAYWLASVLRQKRTELATLVELRDHWGFTSEYVRSCRNYALLTAVSMDNVAMIRHMKTVWGINAADAMECNAIEEAVSHGCIHVLKGLCDIFDLGAADVRKVKNYALSCVFTSYRHESWKVIEMLRIFRECYGLDSASDLMHHKERPILSLAAKRGDVGVMVELLRGWKLTAEDARVNSNEIFINVVSGTPRSVPVDVNVKLLRLLRYGFGLTVDDARSNNNIGIQKAYHGKILAELREGWGMNADDVRDPFWQSSQRINVIVRNCVDDNDLTVFSELRLGYKLDGFDLAKANFFSLRTAAFYALPEFLKEFSQWPRLSDAIEAYMPERKLVLRCFPGAESIVLQHLQLKVPAILVQSYIDRSVFDDSMILSEMPELVLEDGCV